MELIDKLKEQYEAKVEKKEIIKNNNISDFKNELQKHIFNRNEENKNLKTEKEGKKLKKNNQNKKVKINEEEDIKKLRMKNNEKISSFLSEYIIDNEINKQRANSMMSLRQSKTFSSFTTCDSSICFEEKKDGKRRINLNLLIIDNSEIKAPNKRAKEIYQRSKKLYQENLNKKVEEKSIKKNIGKLNNMQKGMMMAFRVTMYPNYNEIRNEDEQDYIEYKNKNKLVYISPDLLLKKIIFEDFVNKNLSLIHHFCQQCFCFIEADVFFQKINKCFQTYKKKKIDFDKIKNLIEFMNILIIEMFEYYDKINFKAMKITFIKKFYEELMLDLINNFKEGEKEKIKDNNKKDINEIIIGNDNDKLKIPLESYGDDMDDQLSNIDFVLNRNSLLNMNLNINEKKVSIVLLKDINDLTNKEKDQISQDNKNEIKSNSKSSDISLQYPNSFKIIKTLKKPINKQSSSKSVNKTNEEMKEENNDDDDDSSSSSIEEIQKNKSDKDNSDNIEFFLKEKIPNNQNSSDIINQYKNQVFNSDQFFISTKEEIMINIGNIFNLLKMNNGQEIPMQDITKAKSGISFYSFIKKRKKNLFESLSSNNVGNTFINRISSFSFYRTKTIASTNSTQKNYFCITEWNIERIGDKLTEVSKSLLNKIKIRELLRGVYLKNDKNIKSPNVINCINNFNKLTSFIIEDVLSYDTPKLRARAYESWVQVCDYLKLNRNYNDCLAIYSALNNYIITGLNQTLREIKSKTKSLFDQISKFCSVEDNYKNIRNDMQQCEQDGDCFIPYLGMLLRDINFIEESFKYINEKGLINMEKIEKMNDLLEKYFKYKNDDKKKAYNKKVLEDLKFLENLEIIKEEELENTANQIEPEFKLGNQGIKRLTNIDKKYFQKNLNKSNNLSTNDKRMSFSIKKLGPQIQFNN